MDNQKGKYKTLFSRYFELVFWVVAMIALAVTNPNGQSHFTLCPLKLLGFNWCPGCGLGHSISFLFHGDLRSSFHAHWLGVPAVIIIFYRIYVLVRMRILPQLFLTKASLTGQEFSETKGKIGNR